MDHSMLELLFFGKESLGNSKDKKDEIWLCKACLQMGIQTSPSQRKRKDRKKNLPGWERQNLACKYVSYTTSL